jgi:hypothetical protein
MKRFTVVSCIILGILCYSSMGLIIVAKLTVSLEMMMGLLVGGLALLMIGYLVEVWYANSKPVV